MDPAGLLSLSKVSLHARSLRLSLVARRSLCLSYNNLGPAGASALAQALATNSGLTTLDLHGNSPGDPRNPPQDCSAEGGRSVRASKRVRKATAGHFHRSSRLPLQRLAGLGIGPQVGVSL